MLVLLPPVFPCLHCYSCIATVTKTGGLTLTNNMERLKQISYMNLKSPLVYGYKTDLLTVIALIIVKDLSVVPVGSLAECDDPHFI